LALEEYFPIVTKGVFGGVHAFVKGAKDAFTSEGKYKTFPWPVFKHILKRIMEVLSRRLEAAEKACHGTFVYFDARHVIGFYMDMYFTEYWRVDEDIVGEDGGNVDMTLSDRYYVVYQDNMVKEVVWNNNVVV
jgi:hypothetical protein